MARKRKSDRSASLLDLAEAPASGNGTGAAGGGEAGASVALHEAAQSRYLNYALSVITSRALPERHHAPRIPSEDAHVETADVNPQFERAGGHNAFELA